MSQTERGWADPKAVQQWSRLVLQSAMVAADAERAKDLLRQVNDPTEAELAAEEAQLP